MLDDSHAGRVLLSAAALAAALALTSCAASEPVNSPPSAAPALPPSDGVDGGGASEVASPALGLVIADDRGELTLLDLDTEERTTLAAGRAQVSVVGGSGRFVHVLRHDGDETAVDIVDSGRWTVPHGDHSHSFAGVAGAVGSVDGTGEPEVRVGDTATGIRFGDDLALLDHEAPAELENAARITLPASADGPALPFAGHLLAATADAVEILDADGTPAGVSAPCTRPADADITRVGAVFACGAGAVLVTREIGGALAAESIPYPVGSPAPTVDLAGRADRPDLAGIAGDEGAWLLDVRAREWTLLPTEVPVLRAAAVGDDDSRTVVVSTDGVVRILADDGSELARTAPLLAASVADEELRDRVQLIVDAGHAYVTDPATRTVHEIDHADGTVTRSFDDLDALHLQLVGYPTPTRPAGPAVTRTPRTTP